MISKAIIPAAGMGTRFLPASKSLPKEMLPILNKPAIQYIVEEGVRAGLKNFVMVGNQNKDIVDRHLTPFSEQELLGMPSAHKQSYSSLQKALYSADMTYVNQHEPSGLGHAIWSARHAIGKEHCAIMLPDDIIHGTTPGIAQLMKVAVQEKCNVVAVQEVPNADIPRYGIVSIKKQFSPNLFQVKELIEKPPASQAPSNLAIVGRYVLSPHIFDALDEINPDASGEVQLTDGIQNLLFSGEKVFAYKIQGDRYDVGDPLGLIKANITYALKSKEYSAQMAEYLESLDRDMMIMQGKAESMSKSHF